METKASFVRANGIIELNPPRSIGADAPIVIFPRNSKNDDSIRFRHSFKNLGILIFLMIQDVRQHRFGNFFDCLMKLGFTWITADQTFDETVQFFF
jgi:hypothetical protein